MVDARRGDMDDVQLEGLVLAGLVPPVHAEAGCPFASVGSSRRSPGVLAGHWVATRRPMSAGVWYQPVYGGISQTASALNSSTSAATS